MSSKQQSISKHRTGGPHGGQSQSNQRQPDYSRSNADRFQSHCIRQTNTGVSPHITSVQVNMQSQPATNALQQNPQNMNPQLIRNYTNNNPPLIQQPAINMGHVNNATPQPPVMPAMINQQRYTTAYMQPNSNRMQNHQVRQPINYIRPNSVQNPNVQSFQTAQLNHPNYTFQQNPAFFQNFHHHNQYLQANQAVQSLYYSPLIYIADNTMNQMNQYPRFPFSQPQVANMANTNVNNSDLNNPPAYKQNEVQQLQQNKREKRERSHVEVYDENGQLVDMDKLASTSKNKPAPTNTQEKTNEKVIDSEVTTMNGANKELDSNCKSKEENVIQDSSDNLCSKVEEPVPSSNDQGVELPKSNENSSSCDMNESEVAIDLISNDQPLSDVNESTEVSDEIEDLTKKVDEIDLEVEESEEKSDEEQDENRNDKPVTAEIVVDEEATNKTSEDIAPSRDENYNTCESMQSTDDMDTVEVIDEPDLMNHESEILIPDENQNYTKSTIPVKEDNELPDQNQIYENNSEKDVKKSYQRDFLLSLRDKASQYALTNSNQDNIKDIIRKNSPSNSSDALLPNYVRANRPLIDIQYRNKSMVQPHRRPSQPSRNYPDQKPRKIASTSLNSEYQHSDEWRLGKIKSTDPEEIETANLLKSVRAILNKLTPQNYQTLLAQFKSFKIDSKDRLTKVIDLIFDKAVLEPAFVVQYAGFCSELIHIKVTEEDEKKETVQVKFKNLLINKCQLTFYKDMYANITDLINQVNETEDPIKKKELKELLDYEKMLSRKRSVGNIKLIAELYKLNMLNAKIMFSCFDFLLKHFNNHKHEEYIECLCALITNIGKNLTEAIKTRFTDMLFKFDWFFDELTKIYNQETETKVSSRIRFMILDLLDLRKNNWVPRRKTEGPKLIAQVHEDIEMQQRLKNESFNEMKKKKTVQQQDEWQQVNKRKSHTGVTTKNLNLNISLLKDISENTSRTNSGNPINTFSIFKTGSHGGSTPGSQSRSSSSNYESKNQNLSNDRNQRAFHDSLNAKNQHTRRNDKKDMTNYQLEKRSGSSQSRTKSESPDSLVSVPQISELEFSEKTNAVLTKYLGTETYSDTINEINSFCSRSKCADFIGASILSSIEKTSQSYNPREKWGQFLGKFFISSNCENTDIFESLKKVFAQYEEFRLDIPKFFEFIGEVLGHALLISYQDPSGKKDIIKTVVKAYNEISGSECTLFRDALLTTVGKNNDKLLQEIRPLFQSNVEIEKFIKLNDIISGFLKNMDLNELKIQIEKNYPNTWSDNFKSALYYKLLEACLKSSMNHHGSHNVNNLDKIKSVIEYYVKSEEDQVLLLLKCATLFDDLNSPGGLLIDIFSYLRENKLVDDSSFDKWENHKNTKTIARASVKRFMDSRKQK